MLNSSIFGIVPGIFEKYEIDFHDDFDMQLILEKAMRREYSNLEACASDLSRVCRLVLSATQAVIVKEFDAHNNCYRVGWVKREVFQQQLKQITLNQCGKKRITALDAFQKYSSELSVIAVGFNSSNERVFNLFNGYKYNELEEVDHETIGFFLDFIHKTIADDNDEVYEYILNWISFIVQNPGLKSEVAIVLQGAQGVGKNQFTNTLSELLSGYSASNITDIDELVGSFNSVIENKMLIVANELRNFGRARLSNHDSLKSIITDTDIRINEKNVPRHNAENVANLILCTNNDFPIKVEHGDRHYLILRVAGDKKGNIDYWADFTRRKDRYFYNNLLTYFLRRDISVFNTRRFPLTEAKLSLIEASGGKFGHWIDRYFNLLTSTGIRANEIMRFRPTDGRFEIDEVNFKLAVKNKLKRVYRTDRDGERRYYYMLRDEYLEGHKQIDRSGDDIFC